jgi:hypothetical protein
MSTLGDKARLVLVEWKPEKGEEHFSGGAPRDPKVEEDGRGRKKKERTN